MDNILESYLVELGFDVKNSEFDHLKKVMADAEATITAHTAGIGKRILEAQFSIVGAFTAVSSAIIGVVDKAAMADQQYRLLGLRWLTSADQARKLSLITDALGASLDEIVWDPELMARAQLMGQHIDKMSAALGPDFENRMRGIRDIQTEFSEFYNVALKFLGMQFAGDLFARLTGSTDIAGVVQEKLQWFEDHIPEISKRLTDYAVPALQETWKIGLEVGGILKEAAVAFANMVGILSGDTSIEGAAFSFEKVAGAIEHVIQGMEKFLDYVLEAEKTAAHFVASLTGVGAASKPKPLSVPFGAQQRAAGILAAGVEESPATVPDHFDAVQRAIVDAARRHNVPPDLALAVAEEESRHKMVPSQWTDKGGEPRTGPAFGYFQLEPSTAKTLGVDAHTPEGNIEGGVQLLRKLLDEYHGDVKSALGAYATGPKGFNEAHGVLSDEAANAIPKILKYQQQFSDEMSHQSAAASSSTDALMHLDSSLYGTSDSAESLDKSLKDLDKTLKSLTGVDAVAASDQGDQKLPNSMLPNGPADWFRWIYGFFHVNPFSDDVKKKEHEDQKDYARLVIGGWLEEWLREPLSKGGARAMPDVLGLWGDKGNPVDQMAERFYTWMADELQGWRLAEERYDPLRKRPGPHSPPPNIDLLGMPHVNLDTKPKATLEAWHPVTGFDVESLVGGLDMRSITGGLTPVFDDGRVDNSWRDAYAAMQQPVQATSGGNTTRMEVSLGGVSVYITPKEGADYDRIRKEVAEGIREAMDRSVLVDLSSAQYSPTW